MQKYEKLEKIGEGKNYDYFFEIKVFFSQLVMNCDYFYSGTYGTVFKAKNRETLEIVALKRVRLDDDDEVFTTMIKCNCYLNIPFMDPTYLLCIGHYIYVCIIIII